MAIRYGNIGEQYFAASDGLPLAGGSLFFTDPATGNEIITYYDQALTIPNPNPVILDASGRQPDIWLELPYNVGIVPPPKLLYCPTCYYDAQLALGPWGMWVLDELGAGQDLPATHSDDSGNGYPLTTLYGTGNTPITTLPTPLDDNRDAVTRWNGGATTGTHFLYADYANFPVGLKEDFTVVITMQRTASYPEGLFISWGLYGTGTRDSITPNNLGGFDISIFNATEGTQTGSSSNGLYPDDGEPHTLIAHFAMATGVELYIDFNTTPVYTFAFAITPPTPGIFDSFFSLCHGYFGDASYAWLREGDITAAEITALGVGWDRNFLTYVQP